MAQQDPQNVQGTDHTEMKGCYLLLIRLEEDSVVKTRAKSFLLPKGHYVYVGSGMRNLLERVGRHLKREHKKLFWHVDYLLTRGVIEGVFLFPSHEKCEERVAEILGRMLKNVRGFGASDSPLESHLFVLSNREEFGEVVSSLLRSL